MTNGSQANFIRIVLIVVIGVALVGLIMAVRHLAHQPVADTGKPEPPPPKDDVPKKPFTFAKNEDCQGCHQEVWEEWAQDQHSMSWFNRPFLPQDPKRTECNNCHAPQPILEVGIEEMPLIRSERYEEGVGCIECHRNVDHVEGPAPTAEAACNPVQNQTYSQSRICRSCHAPHGTFEEMKNSPWGKTGITCQDCHMPPLLRASAEGGPVRVVRSHRMRTQRDPTMLREALTFEASIEDGKLKIVLVNVGAAHNVPGEIFNREMFVLTKFTDPEGKEAGEHREVIKTVRREQRGSLPSTQIKPGEERKYEYAVPGKHGKVSILVGYKLLFMTPDDWAEKVYEKEMEY